MAKPAGETSLRKHDMDLELWGETPAPPCEEHKCSDFVRCGVLGLACHSFAEYVRTGKVYPPSTPTARIFDELNMPLAPHLTQKNRSRVRPPANSLIKEIPNG